MLTRKQGYLLHNFVILSHLIAAVAKTDNWPIKKDTIIKKHYKAFAEFTRTMEKIKELNTL